jgi:tyrosine decarboxylase/aspartate 1-decarboxylase
MENTFFLVKKIQNINKIKLVTDPVMNIVGFTSENGDKINDIEEKLRKLNWMVGKFELFNIIRIVVMPHVQKNHLVNFCNDLEKILEKL